MTTISRIDSASLMRIKSLELRARVVVEGLWRGLHRSPFHGFSVEFTEYRQYTKGDDLRHLDWKVAARTDRYYIKKFEDETNLRCHLLLDQSKSMSFGSGGFSKEDYAATLVATLSYFLMQQGDAVGLTTFGERIAEHIPARNRPGHLRRVLTELERKPAFKGTSLQASLRGLAELLRRRGMVVLVSDLLAPAQQLNKQLGYLATQGHEVVLFHVMDRAEIDFTFGEAALFRDTESGAQMFVDPAAARPAYLAKLKEHLDAVRGICEKHGVNYRWSPTDQPLDQVLLSFLSERGSR
jgi:uncharacterized protein (DUF58 family)